MKTVEVSKKAYIDGVENTQRLLLGMVTGSADPSEANAALQASVKLNARVEYVDGKFMASADDAELINTQVKAYEDLENKCLQVGKNVVL